MTDTLTTNPLVAPRQDSRTWHTGITLLDDASGLQQSIASGSWMDAGMSALGTGMDVVAMATNPVATVVSYAMNYLVETVQPLNDALNWLAGDADQIAAYAATWQNVSQAVGQGGQTMTTSLDKDAANWTGTAATSYRDVATDRAHTIMAASTAAGTVGKATELIGQLVRTVRDTIRNLVTQAVGQVVQTALLALGVITIPLVVARVATQVASWMRRIADTVKKLTSSLAKLRPLMQRLAQLWSEIKQALAEARAESEALRRPTMLPMARPPRPRRGGRRPGGTPRSRDAQQKAADGAWNEIQRRLGRRLSKADRRRWHDEITEQNLDYHGIVEHGVDMFGR